MIQQWDFPHKLVILFLFYVLLCGCSSYGQTKPNDLFSGPYPIKFDLLKSKNALIVNEIGKLPEFQDGVSAHESKALELICDVYSDNQSAFDLAFDQMYRIGKPAVRKYCSPLQALYWLAEDKMDYLELKKIICDYSLDKLLSKYWGVKEYGLLISRYQIDNVISNIKEDRRKTDYLKLRKERGYAFIEKILKINYLKNPGFFNDIAQEILKNGLNASEVLNKKMRQRWDNFEHVTDRLNAPELVDRYIDKSIKYIWDHGVCQSPSYTFSRKKGCCVCAARLGQYCLEKAGYKTFIRHLTGTGYNDMHGVLVVEIKDQYFIVVDFIKNSRNRMSGPFKSISEVDEQIASSILSDINKRRYQHYLD